MHLDGRIEVHTGSPTGRIAAIGVAHNGGFQVRVAPGRYWLVGRSRQVKVNGHPVSCAALHAVEVRRGHISRAAVYCQIR